MAGANLLFLGTTRQLTGDVETLCLDYDAYRPRALEELKRLRQQALNGWPLTAVSIVHRLGRVPLEEASVAIAVSSPHRVESFAAATWLLEELKQRVRDRIDPDRDLGHIDRSSDTT